jgi:predicted phage terminase large subunit-like protein
MVEYLVLYLAVFGEIEGFGKVDGMIYVSDSMDNGVKSARKNIEFRYENSDFLKEWIPEAKFTDNYLEFKNKDGKLLGVKMFGAKTGLRGTKIFGKRPVLAVLDDLLSDDDAKSKAAMVAIKDTVYKGVDYALDPTRRKILFNGTPFNKDDILYEAVESGAWDVNVWPICERFPCSKEEFRGAWEDRFTYDYVAEQYRVSALSGKLAAFNQELMLRISSEEERLVQDSEIRWYSRQSLLKNRGRFNFYITTDFATSDRETADFSVISVWAYNANGDWFWVDGVCERQTMDKTVNDLFRLVSEYRPQQVGIEITGQQGAFIHWLQQEQMARNIWFTFAQEKGKPGIRPTVNKLSRFNLVVPLFKAGKIYFPEEMKASKILGEFMSQISLATINGLKGKDDCLDTVSMLMHLTPWKPTEDTPMAAKPDGRWEIDDDDDDRHSAMDSYIV